MKERLTQLILDYAFQFSEIPTFKLVHGGLSQFYFNCKRVTLDPEGQYLIGNLVFAAIREPERQGHWRFDARGRSHRQCGGLHLLAAGNPVQAFVVRKKPKEHGTASLIEGRVRTG